MTRRLLGLSVLFCLWSITAQTALAGQFKHAVYVHTKARPGRVVSAQLTSSGNLDLAFTSLYDNQIIVLLGNGDGTFKAPRLFAASNPLGIAVGDFNEDGHPDLVVVELNGTGKGSVAVFLGDGNGGFGESSTYLIGEESAGVAVADFNGDGHLDLAVTDAGFEGQGADLTIFFGDGTGKFRKSQTTKSSKHPSGVATGDLNGDGRPDIVISEAQTDLSACT